MARQEDITYIFSCDLCGDTEADECDEEPYGWETIENDILLCSSCYVEYDVIDDEDEKELYLRDLA